MEKIRIGLVGIGYLGSIHLELLLALDAFELIGVFDRNKEKCALVQEKYPNITLFDTYQDLLAKVQAVGIIASTPSHFQLALEALKAQKAVFIEKPLCQTAQEAAALIEAHKKGQVLFQVGHVERFNRVWMDFEAFVANAKPDKLEAWRMAPFQQRGADVSVVLDLMIHDLDLLLSLTRASIIQIEVEAKSTHTHFPDEVEAALFFDDGFKAKLIASRMATERQRKMRITSNAQTFELDFSAQKSNAHNALQFQWQHFAACFQQQLEPKVGLMQGAAALNLALQIEALAQQALTKNSEPTQ